MLHHIQTTVQRIFRGADECDWQLVRQSFASQVLLDYTSMNGGTPATLTPQQISDAWQQVFPGFDATHHQLGNFEIQPGDSEATVFCYGTATHYLPHEKGNVWTVVGTYDFHLVKENDDWKADRMMFRFKYQDGNTDLPKLAMDKAKERSFVR